jgi:hypothetical protein
LAKSTDFFVAGNKLFLSLLAFGRSGIKLTLIRRHTKYSENTVIRKSLKNKENIRFEHESCPNL